MSYATDDAEMSSARESSSYWSDARTYCSPTGVASQEGPF